MSERYDSGKSGTLIPDKSYFAGLAIIHGLQTRVQNGITGLHRLRRMSLAPLLAQILTGITENIIHPDWLCQYTACPKMAVMHASNTQLKLGILYKGK